MLSLSSPYQSMLNNQYIKYYVNDKMNALNNPNLLPFVATNHLFRNATFCPGSFMRFLGPLGEKGN